ncbi:MAG: DUF262 domain-containing protein [Gemmatimonadetes bacterium]|nr:DUF262 domain-containing protein [Gemmatimonadota bacterium]
MSNWFTRIRHRQIVLPRFQRFEAWTDRHVRGLLDTVLRKLPAGALLTLEVGDEEPFVSRPMSGAPSKGDRVGEHLLDGQQRLTALWRSMTADYPDRTYLVEVESLDDEEDELSRPPRAVSYGRWERDGKRYPLWLDLPTEVWRRRLIPVELLRPDAEAEAAFKEWVKGACPPEETFELFEIGTNLRTTFALFNLPFLSLPSDTPREVALDVFVKMNTSAQPLSTYDIVVAQIEAHTEFSLHELVEELRAEAPRLERFVEPSKVILTSGAYIQDKAPRNATLLSTSFCEGLIDHWDLLANGARRATEFLSDEHVFDKTRLPTDPVVPLLAALWARAPDGLDAEGEARTVLRRFLWRAFLTDRYEKAVNTRALVDYRALRAMIADQDKAMPPIFHDDSHAVVGVEDIVLAGWPKKKDRLGRAVMLISLRAGGLDFADGSPAKPDSLQSREYHHLFPAALLSGDVDDAKIHRALNCALVTWKTNRNIAATSPMDYLRKRIDASSLGEGEIRRRLQSHVIDYDLLANGNYDSFLEGRAETVHSIARELCA